jgi:hypothetical protein
MIRVALALRPRTTTPRSANFATFSGSSAPYCRVMTDDIERLPGVDDEPAGVYYPHASSGTDDDIDAETARLFAECKAKGEHHLATRDDPTEGLVIACTHCHRFWREPNA